MAAITAPFPRRQSISSDVEALLSMMEKYAACSRTVGEFERLYPAVRGDTRVCPPGEQGNRNQEY
jgi:hypothetical protein